MQERREINMSDKQESQYSDREIELARRIYDATMLVTDRMTTRKAKNLTEKLGFPTPNEITDEYYLETARKLILYSEEELKKIMRKAVNSI